MSSVDVAMFDGVHKLRDEEPAAPGFRQRILGQLAPSWGRGERPRFRNFQLQITVPPYPCQPNAWTGTGLPAVANCVGEGFVHREYYAFQRLAVRCAVCPQPVTQAAHCRPHVFQSCGNRHAGPLERADCRWSGRFMHGPECAKPHSLEQACAHAHRGTISAIFVGLRAASSFKQLDETPWDMWQKHCRGPRPRFSVNPS